jgi:hypothetical protein
LLLDEDGLVRPIGNAEVVQESALIRFDVIPPDQLVLKAGEFLVVALFCRKSKGQAMDVSLERSFIFKILPGEIAESTIRRIGLYKFFSEHLLPYVNLRVKQRVLNRDEPVDMLLKPNDVLRIILPDRVKAVSVLKKMGAPEDRGELFALL